MIAAADKIEALPYECPLCDVFPFATAEQLGEHIARNEHVGPPRVPTGRGVVDDLPDYGTGTGGGSSTARPADGPSEKQIGFYGKLVDERRGTFGDELADDLLAKFATLSKRAASTAIDAVMKVERTPKAATATATSTTPATPATPEQVLTPGMYRVGETIYKVQPAKGSGNLYAKRLGGDIETGFFFDYEQGAIRTVRAEGVRLTLDEAKAFGQRTGTCCVCAAVLTNPESIALGIGPVCGGRM